MEPDEKNIAICYFLKEEDENNTCELTDYRLVVRRKGKVHEFLVGQIKFLQINQRKLLIPIIFSGIFTPLIVVGFFEGFFHPVIATLFIVTGIFTFYLGWLGQKVLTIELDHGHADFPIDHEGRNLLAFIDFTNDYLEHVPIEIRSVYMFREGHKVSQGEEDISSIIPPYELYSYQHLKEYLLANPHRSEGLIWVIDPLKTGGQIKYEFSKKEGCLKPVLKEKLNKRAVIGKYTIHDFLLISRKK